MKAVMVNVYPLVKVVLKELVEHSYQNIQVTEAGKLDALDPMSLGSSDLLIFDLTGGYEAQLTMVEQASSRFGRAKKLFFVDRSFSDLEPLINQSGGLCVFKDLAYSEILSALNHYDPASRRDHANVARSNDFQSDVHFPGADKPLTKNQVRAMECLCEGMSAKEVARAMGVGYDTARAHIKGAFCVCKLKTRRRPLVTSRLPCPIHKGCWRADSLYRVYPFGG